ncbi:spore germination protein [Bacillus sp. HNG]|uniref:spore germination protein n=1 Tax=Bacillus sp. HNG TaxID=2293325 RepID=UPI0021D534B5|nr:MULTISPECIES: spore germination protein [Bacillus]
MKAPVDIHFTALAATFGQTLRLLGLSVSLLLPAFFVAILSYHQDQLPYYHLPLWGLTGWESLLMWQLKCLLHFSS